MLGMACAAALFALRGEASDETLVVRPGESVSARLEPESNAPATVSVLAEVQAAGLYTLVVSSAAFDVAVVGGDLGVETDDDVGPGFDEILVWSFAEAGLRRFDVRGRGSIGGDVAIRLIAGRAPLSSLLTLSGELERFEQGFRADGAELDEKRFRRVRELSRDALLCGDGTTAEKASALLVRLARSEDEKRCSAAVAARIDHERGNKSARDTVDELLARPDLPAVAFVDAARTAAALCLAVEDVGTARDFLTDISRRARESDLQVDEALAESLLGELASEDGNSEEAGEHFDSVLILAEALRGPAAFTVQCAAGQFFRYAGDMVRARECFDRAAGNAVVLAHQLDVEIRQCDLDIHTGDFVAAERRITEIGAAERAASEKPELIPYLEDLAHLQFRMGRLHESRRLVDLVLKEKRGIDPLVNTEALLTLGLIEESEGRLDAAIEAFDTAQRTYETADSRSKAAGLWDLLALQINRGRVLVAQGELKRAEEEFQSAYAVSTARGRPLETAAAQDGMASIRRMQGRFEEARVFIEPATQEYLRAKQYDYLLDSTLLTAARVALDTGRLEECGKALADAKAMLAAADPLAPVTAARLRSRYSNWGELEQDYWMRSGAKDPEHGPAIAWRAFLSAGDWKARALLAGIRSKPLEPPKSTEDILRSVLGRDGALIEFASGERDLRAYVLVAEDLHVLELGDKTALEEDVWEYIDAMFRDPRFDAPADVARAGHALFERLLERALNLLPSHVTRLVIVPNDWLAALPFEGLVFDVTDPAPKDFAQVPYVLDRFEVSYAPASQVLARLIMLPPRKTTGRALLLGDAIFPPEEGTTPALRDGGGDLERLRHSRREVLEIADLLLPSNEDGGAEDRTKVLGLGSRRQRDGSAHSAAVDVLLGRDASVRRLLQSDLTSLRILHLATHAKADAADPAQSALWLSAGDDGVRRLDLAKIRSLPLDCDLVALSACETARGGVLKGEGVQSIALAFLESGARSVVASLWVVGDENAADLMTRFYAQALGPPGTRYSRALTLAKREIRSDPGQRGAKAIDGRPLLLQSGHPNSWAKFVLIGTLQRAE